MLKPILKFILLFSIVSSVFSQDAFPVDTAAVDTNALVLAWKHKTLTDNMVKFAGFALILPNISGREIEGSLYPWLFFGGSAFGTYHGLRMVKKGEGEIRLNMRKGVWPEKPFMLEKNVDPASYFLSMGWRSLLGMFAGSFAGASLDLVAMGLLPEGNRHVQHPAVGIGAGAVYGFYKGLEDANGVYGLPVGSPFMSLLSAAITNYVLELSFYRTIGINPPPDDTIFLIPLSLYFGYNLDNWQKIFANN